MKKRFVISQMNEVDEIIDIPDDVTTEQMANIITDFINNNITFYTEDTLTTEEYDNLLKMKDIYNTFFIVRNKNGSLRLFTHEPYQTNSTWEFQELDYFNDIDGGIVVDHKMFTFITWNSNKCWSHEELLKLAVIE